MTPTQLSLKKLRSEGYHAGIVEKWNSFAKIRIDLFGAIDILACRDGENGVMGIQTTSTGNMSARIKKAIAIPAMRTFIGANNRFYVWGWAKRGARGKRKVWELKEFLITKERLEELNETESIADCNHVDSPIVHLPG